MPANAKEAPSLAAQVNTESLESAAEKYKDFKEPPVSVTVSTERLPLYYLEEPRGQPCFP
jgi:hypothetical protein